MKAYVYSQQHLIGETDLVPGDVTMGCVQGIFLPTEYYLTSIRVHVWAINNNAGAGYMQWYHLALSVQLENGYFLHPVGGYTINDIAALPTAPITIDVMGLHHQVMKQFFSGQSSVAFITRPWDKLTIQRKHRLEEQLKKEVPATERTFPWLWAIKNKHVLAGISCVALCADPGSDDVLFSIIGLPLYNFARVHLTWHGPESDPAYPTTNLFETYDDFQREIFDPEQALREDEED